MRRSVSAWHRNACSNRRLGMMSCLLRVPFLPRRSATMDGRMAHVNVGDLGLQLPNAAWWSLASFHAPSFAGATLSHVVAEGHARSLPVRSFQRQASNAIAIAVPGQACASLRVPSDCLESHRRTCSAFAKWEIMTYPLRERAPI